MSIITAAITLVAVMFAASPASAYTGNLGGYMSTSCQTPAPHDYACWEEYNFNTGSFVDLHIQHGAGGHDYVYASSYTWQYFSSFENLNAIYFDYSGDGVHWSSGWHDTSWVNGANNDTGTSSYQVAGVYDGPGVWIRACVARLWYPTNPPTYNFTCTAWH